jgi:hypothetical protein
MIISINENYFFNGLIAFATFHITCVHTGGDENGGKGTGAG